jgi:hypothetical protein
MSDKLGKLKIANTHCIVSCVNFLVWFSSYEPAVKNIIRQISDSAFGIISGRHICHARETISVQILNVWWLLYIKKLTPKINNLRFVHKVYQFHKILGVKQQLFRMIPGFHHDTLR